MDDDFLLFADKEYFLRSFNKRIQILTLIYTGIHP